MDNLFSPPPEKEWHPYHWIAMAMLAAVCFGLPELFIFLLFTMPIAIFIGVFCDWS